MTATRNTVGAGIKDQINQQDDNQQAVGIIDEYLAKKKTGYPYQRMAMAAYELVSDGSPYVCNKFWLHFILGLEAVMMDPCNRRELTSTVNVTDFGITEGFIGLKKFFAAFYGQAEQAEVYRIGLTEYSDRYRLPDLDVAEIIEEVAKFSPYP